MTFSHVGSTRLRPAALSLALVGLLALVAARASHAAPAAALCRKSCAEQFRDCVTTVVTQGGGKRTCRAPRRQCRHCCGHAGPACRSIALVPRQAPEYYVDQANKYFDDLDTRFDPNVVPNYAALAARWELPPWLWLTGYGRDNMIFTTRAALTLDPSTVPVRDCRAFPVQPFARCVVSFSYAGGNCPIYEEFTFNDQGETTFIEAWSDLPGYRPTDDPTDRWGEGPGVRRLSTRVPGLGGGTGLIDLDAEWMRDAAGRDPELADFIRRARDFWPSWFQALDAAGPDYFARGCGW